jgi:hypothetical protein
MVTLFEELKVCKGAVADRRHKNLLILRRHHQHSWSRGDVRTVRVAESGSSREANIISFDAPNRFGKMTLCVRLVVTVWVFCRCSLSPLD